MHVCNDQILFNAGRSYLYRLAPSVLSRSLYAKIIEVTDVILNNTKLYVTVLVPMASMCKYCIVEKGVCFLAWTTSGVVGGHNEYCLTLGYHWTNLKMSSSLQQIMFPLFNLAIMAVNFRQNEDFCMISIMLQGLKHQHQ